MRTIHDIAVFVAIFAFGMLAGYVMKVVIEHFSSHKDCHSAILHFIKKYWCIFPLLIIFTIIPIVINWLMLKSTFVEVYNGDWLSFLGAYLGAIVPFIILFFTIKNNNSQNQKNRETQSKYIKCQVDYERLDKLNASFSGYLCALNQMELGLIAYQAKYEPIASRNKVETILKQADQAFEFLKLSLILFDDDKSYKLKDYLANFQNEYIAIIPDLCFIINSYAPGSPNENLDNLINQNQSVNKRIIEIIKKGGYDIKINQADVMYDLVMGLDFENLEKEITEFILYEKIKIDRQMDTIKQDDSTLNYRP